MHVEHAVGGGFQLPRSRAVGAPGAALRAALSHDLDAKGVNYAELPARQRYGIGVYFRTVKKEGFNPKTKQKTQAYRRELFADMELLMGEEYRLFITELLDEAKKE